MTSLRRILPTCSPVGGRQAHRQRSGTAFTRAPGALAGRGARAGQQTGRSFRQTQRRAQHGLTPRASRHGRHTSTVFPSATSQRPKWDVIERTWDVVLLVRWENKIVQTLLLRRACGTSSRRLGRQRSRLADLFLRMDVCRTPPWFCIEVHIFA